MRALGPDPARQHARRKQDLLLASQLARGLAAGAVDELADRADLIVGGVERVRMWLSSPLVLTAGPLAAALLLGFALRRGDRGPVLRWAWLAWKLWRNAGPLLALLWPLRPRSPADRNVRWRTDLTQGAAWPVRGVGDRGRNDAGGLVAH